jgi:hypothetical protein
MAKGNQMYGTEWGATSNQAMHYGKYTYLWSDPINTTRWTETGTYGGSIDHTRVGLLYSDIPIYTIGLGVEHHAPVYEPEILNYTGEVVDLPNATFIGNDGPFNATYPEAYNESGTLEYNLWRLQRSEPY